jgi:hypothetical protein
MRKVITNKHPFMEKVNALYEYMEDNNIAIAENLNGGLNIIDTTNDKAYHLRDVDSSEMSPVFPSGVEFKLTYENNIE